MVKVKILCTCLFALFLVGQLKSQSLVLVLTNEKNDKEYVVKHHDRIRVDIKNNRGKLKEKEEVVVLSIDKKNLYISPEKQRFGEQAIAIDEMKHIWIKTPGTRILGGCLFGLNLLSGTSNVPKIYKKINLGKRKWKINVEDRRLLSRT